MKNILQTLKIVFLNRMSENVPLVMLIKKSGTIQIKILSKKNYKHITGMK